MDDYAPERVRLLGDRAIGTILSPKVGERIIMPSYLPSKTVEVVNSNVEGVGVGDVVILNSHIPLSNYAQDTAGKLVLFSSTDIICKVVDDRIVPFGAYILLTDAGEAQSTKRVIPGGTRWAATHYYVSEDGTRYIAPNTAGLVVTYKGHEYRFFLEDDLLAIVEEETSG